MALFSIRPLYQATWQLSSVTYMIQLLLLKHGCGSGIVDCQTLAVRPSHYSIHQLQDQTHLKYILFNFLKSGQIFHADVLIHQLQKIKLPDYPWYVFRKLGHFHVSCSCLRIQPLCLWPIAQAYHVIIRKFFRLVLSVSSRTFQSRKFESRAFESPQRPIIPAPRKFSRSWHTFQGRSSSSLYDGRIQ